MTKDEHQRVQELRMRIAEMQVWMPMIRHRSDEYELRCDEMMRYRREIESIENRYS